MSRERFLRLLDAAEYLAEHIQGGGCRSRLATRCPLVCSAADRLPYGPVWAGSSYCAHRCRPSGSIGSALSGSVATRSTRRSRNGWRRNLPASVIVVFDPEGHTGCQILTDRKLASSL